jgi:hypothetical protein
MKRVIATVCAALSLTACGEMTVEDVGHCYAYHTAVKNDAGTDAVAQSFMKAITKVSVSEVQDQAKLWMYAHARAASPEAKAELVSKAKKSCSRADMPQ